MWRIDQGIIQKYTGARICDVRILPDNYIATGVRLPHVLASQTKPLEKSVVLVASLDSYKSFIIAVLREPLDFVTNENALRGDSDATKDQLLPGEVYLESRGNPDAPFPGSGSSLHLGNDGTVSIRSGKWKEFLVLGGSLTDEDASVILQGDNGFFQSNISGGAVGVRSSFTFDKLNNLRIANDIVTASSSALTAVPVSELKMTALGEITLRNVASGVTTGQLHVATSGAIQLRNTTASVVIGVDSTVNLNNGSLGVARLTDTVLSDETSDPLWWEFWTNLSSLIEALPTTPADGGATLKSGLATLFSILPLTLTGKISSASTTVKAG